MSNTLVRRGAITAIILIAVLFVAYVLSFGNYTEFKNSVRSIEVVRNVQNFLYHLKHPPMSAGALGDGRPASEIVLVEPVSVVEGPDGSIYISDRSHRVWRVGDDGIARVFAGNGYRGAISNGAKARESRLGVPEGLAVDRRGRVYFADSYNDVVARVNEAGVIEIVAGTGVRGFDAEVGPATEIRLNKPYDVAVDVNGALYIIDNRSHRLRKVAPDGIMSTVIGAGNHEPSDDPQSSQLANLLLPWGVFVDSSGRVYVADGGHHLIRRVNLDGSIETVAGNGVAGYAGDGGSAVEAMLNVPQSMYLRQDGSLLIEDEHNHVIRLVDPGGIITTIAGIGKPSDVLDTKDSLRIGLNDPEDVIERRDGTILIADRLNRRIISIKPDGTAAIFAGRRNRPGVGTSK